MTQLLPHRAFLIAGALSLAVLTSVAAQAFTIEDRSNTTGDSAAKFSDSDPRYPNSGNNTGTTIRQGNTTMQFGAPQRGADRYFNTDNMFQPNGRPMGER